MSNDIADSGGLTNLGITHSEYDHYRAQKNLPFQSVKEISLHEAKDIYRHTYWLSSHCAEMPRRIAISCFDEQVNTGRAIVALQLILGIKPDGIAGTETFNELNSWLSKPKNEDKLLCNYFRDRENHYLVWGVGSQRKFLKGWLRRSRSLKEELNIVG